MEYARAKEILGAYSITEASLYFMRHHSEALTPRPVKDVYDELIQQRTKAGLSDRYLEDLRYRLGAFSKGFVCEVNQITPAQVELWLDALGLSARSHNNHLRALNTFFNFAKVRKYLSKDFDPLEGIMRRREKAGRVTVFTAKELALLLNNASKKHPDYLVCLVLGAFAGLRQSEIVRLSWDDIERRLGNVEAEAGNSSPMLFSNYRELMTPEDAAAWFSVEPPDEGKVVSMQQSKSA